MFSAEFTGRDTLQERDLFVLEIPTAASLPSELRLTSRRFACVIACDADSATDLELSELARRLLDAGAVYVCAWGPGCERVHDIFDQERESIPTVPEREVVMTTWHHDESLADALGFALMSASPSSDELAAACGATLALSIGSAQWADEMREAFKDPRAFFARWLSSEPE